MLRRWLIMGFGVGSLAVALASGYAWAARPTTYRDAVREALDQRRVAYSGVDVRETCRPDPTCVISDGMHSSAAVMVQGRTASSGLITCYNQRGDCYLDLPSLQITRAPLRDLRGVWLISPWLAHVWERAAAWLRGWFRPTPSS
jgi:hypothetical protein